MKGMINKVRRAVTDSKGRENREKNVIGGNKMENVQQRNKN